MVNFKYFRSNKNIWMNVTSWKWIRRAWNTQRITKRESTQRRRRASNLPSENENWRRLKEMGRKIRQHETTLNGWKIFFLNGSSTLTRNRTSFSIPTLLSWNWGVLLLLFVRLIDRVSKQANATYANFRGDITHTTEKSLPDFHSFNIPFRRFFFASHSLENSMGQSEMERITQCAKINWLSFISCHSKISLLNQTKWNQWLCRVKYLNGGKKNEDRRRNKFKSQMFECHHQRQRSAAHNSFIKWNLIALTETLCWMFREKCVCVFGLGCHLMKV